MDLDVSKDKIKILDHTQYFTHGSLSPQSVHKNPLKQFELWFQEAVINEHVREPEAMTLATATPDAIPSARIVLFKQLDRGFIFFTNYNSRKSQELHANPRAALVFYWREIHRSVRILGKVEKVSRKESEEYFKSRPLGSRLGAWASNQSSVIQEGEITQRLHDMEEQFGVVTSDDQDADIPLPEFWGGWRVVPDEIEFWMGRPSRLHDRVRYRRISNTLDDDSQWEVDRLSP